MSEKPIKRNEHIISLSREHHFSLLFGWKIKNGLKLNINPHRICKYVLYFWENNLSIHFNQEEETLFAVHNDDLVTKALVEHEIMRSEIKALKNPEDEEEMAKHLTRLADMVTAHVRFEERDLFPHLEKILSPEQMKKIGHELNEMQAEPLRDDYEDEFWLRK